MPRARPSPASSTPLMLLTSRCSAARSTWSARPKLCTTRLPAAWHRRSRRFRPVRVRRQLIRPIPPFGDTQVHALPIRQVPARRRLLQTIVCLGFSADLRQLRDHIAGKSTPCAKTRPSHLPIHRERRSCSGRRPNQSCHERGPARRSRRIPPGQSSRQAGQIGCDGVSCFCSDAAGEPD